jgi:hypothetical protein
MSVAHTTIRDEVPIDQSEAQPRCALQPGITRRETLEQKLKRRQAEIAARLHTIATTKKAEAREREARLDRIIGTACRADKAMHESIRMHLKSVKAPSDREFLKIEGWL